MGLCQMKNICTVLFILLTFLASHDQQVLVAATRPLEGEQWLKKDGRLAIQSLRSPVPSSGNSCTNIPGRGGSGNCKLNAMNIAGSVVTGVLPPFPDLVVKVGVANSAGNSDTHDKDQSS